jgi:SOS-response transcriptional repressor LexA
MGYSEHYMAQPSLTEHEKKLLEFIDEYIKKLGRPPSLRDVSSRGPFNSTRNIMLLEDLIEHQVLEEELTTRDDKEINVYRPAKR